jgi:hypothetical protein
MMDYRRARVSILARELNIDAADIPKLLDRYAATSRKASDPDGSGHLQTFSTFAEACSELGDGVLEGYLPAGVYDLDTGELIELHVSTPVVTRSEDQGVTINPLQAVLRCPSGHTWSAPIIEDAEGALVVTDDHHTLCPNCRALGGTV